MKAKSIIAAFAAVLLTVTSCGVMGGAGSTEDATSNGTSVGAALLNIYTQYKTTGTIDLSSLANIINIAQIANAIGGLTGATDSFVSDFTNGLISGSQNLVNAANAASVVGKLKNLAQTDLAAINSAAKTVSKTGETAAAEASAEVASAVSAVSSILKSFAK